MAIEQTRIMATEDSSKKGVT